MPRIYTPRPTGKKYKKYDVDIMKKAVDELQINRSAVLSEVAKKYNIHKSVLHRHCKKIMKPQGGQTALSKETEEYIIENINICAEWGYPMDTMDLRYIVKMYLDEQGFTHKRFKNNLPGPDFVQYFLKRHKEEISQRIYGNIKTVKSALTPQTIKEYFTELQNTLEGVPLSNILNYDERSLSNDPDKINVLTKRECKYPERMMNHLISSVSIMIAGTANGEMLPPYVVYKGTHLYDKWLMNGPKGVKYNRSTSGWFEGVIFQDWIQHMVIPYFKDKPGRKCLIGDSLTSRLSIDLIKLCKEHKIDFVFLPANSTHVTQPLDVTFFRMMKDVWRQILLIWKDTDDGQSPTIPNNCFPVLLNMLIDELNKYAKSNIITGYKKTGIYPLNVNEILSRLTQEKSDSDVKLEITFNDSVLERIKEMRNSSMNINETKIVDKHCIVAGRSITIEDSVETDSVIHDTHSKEIKEDILDDDKSFYFIICS